MKVLKTNTRKLLADMHTPVSLFYKLRAKYPEVLLLESSDYSSKEDSKSFLCFSSLATFSVAQGTVTISGSCVENSSNVLRNLVQELNDFKDGVPVENDGLSTSLFGYTSFDCIEYFENIQLTAPRAYDMPDVRYDIYKYVLIYDHYHGSLELCENVESDEESKLEDIITIIEGNGINTFHFKAADTIKENMSDARFMELVNQAKNHSKRGDVFQIVPSRRFQVDFIGDEFNVYRALRSINPSPYLYYFDYSKYKIFGSSPEAQLCVDDGIAEIHPIAGTVRRSGDYEEDIASTKRLQEDPKENAEHTMLVDLARNDLSRNCDAVYVDRYKDIQYFSHVIHLVSKVKGKVKSGISDYQILADTFPAGTLSGAPKYRALQLIDGMEPERRGFYGGAIGIISRTSGINHAIMIRSFLSIDNTLSFQAGAGIVIDSDPQSELQEVKNKVAALETALATANRMK